MKTKTEQEIFEKYKTDKCNDTDFKECHHKFNYNLKQAIHEAYISSPSARELSRQKEAYGAQIEALVKQETAAAIFSDFDGLAIWDFPLTGVQLDAHHKYEAIKRKYLGKQNKE